MIRNVIKAILFFSIVVSASSVAHVAIALDLSLGDLSSADSYHSFAWMPETAQQQSSQNISSKIKQHRELDSQISETAPRKFSLQVHQGDGLDNLRRNPDKHNMVILPKEDTDVYGISVKQRF